MSDSCELVILGSVTEINEAAGVFYALLDVESERDTVATIFMDKVAESDRDLLRPGAYFRISDSGLKFLREPVWTAEEIAEAKLRATEITARIQWE